jgi:acyl-CoA hydrolase
MERANMKRIGDSYSVISDMIQPNQANPAGNAHGGEIMKMMDNCGGVAASRHSKSNVVTVRVDEIIFYKPIFVGNLVVCEAKIIYTGRTSMDVKVTVKVEDVLSEKPPEVALSAYFTFVAMDRSGKPKPVPGLILETEEEKAEFERAKKRYEKLKERRNKN